MISLLLLEVFTTATGHVLCSQGFLAIEKGCGQLAEFEREFNKSGTSFQAGRQCWVTNVRKTNKVIQVISS